ncbi:peptidase C14 caspase catalytic subunit p20 [Sinorhizobium meliloti]|uniref:caspase family protein n=1 Tax=Rhizobium meliloti TaxID=382 RepID=UPI0001E4C850|nr:caspase family protein [Sinorhizobium meliloti]AEG06550.1 peptidase C14 caspase catalytic subunit p20 [Sinorhizobium meliloti BL225C]MDE4547026.1 caspase family protein [Sinorhizobium meliloti]MDE4570665.1 caspase family protein [Sinorhizobium meliloti]MDX0315942.1 peptidase C14 caspase catalytic subunit p20 [Sinorhizobium meliloti]PTD30294.1 peptidase C14 caspase catalytic subunit p20 [Sinorhizobium meliloti]
MRTFAIVVGINQYPPRAGQRELHGAVADACDFAEWALEKGGGNVDPEDLYFWTYPWPSHYGPELAKYMGSNLPHWFNIDADDETAPPIQSRPPHANEIVFTGQKLIAERAKVFSLEKRQETRILVFLAGHGLRASELNSDRRQTCFIAGNFKPIGNIAEGLVPCESFRRALRNRRFSTVLMFLDCCRRDNSVISMAAVPLCDLIGDQQHPGWGECYAAQNDELAYETDAPPIRGVFSKALLDGLRRCRQRIPPELRLEHLRHYVNANIVTYDNHGQRAHFIFEPTEPSIEIVSASSNSGMQSAATGASQSPTVVYVDALEDGQSLVLLDSGGSKLWEVGPLVKGSGPIELPELPVGFYALQVKNEPHREVLFRHPNGRTIHVK